MILIDTKYTHMKKIASIFILALVAITGVVQAQAWSESSKVITLGIGGAYHHRFLPGETYVGSRGWGSTSGTLLVQGDFGIHKYVGLGFIAGIAGGASGVGIRGYRGVGYGSAPGYYGGSTDNVNLVAGFNANFHFYQLIADKVSKDIHADKLDIYAGANLGSGFGYDFSFDNVSIPIWGGLHVGARYYFTDKIGVYLEAAPYTGKSFIAGGVAFNL